jgi:hypothetical protein
MDLSLAITCLSEAAEWAARGAGHGTADPIVEVPQMAGRGEGDGGGELGRVVAHQVGQAHVGGGAQVRGR